MNITGIVCEYNPFHKGHEYQILESRRQLEGESIVVCVMSGDYVQRGEAAIFSKFARAEAACRCGADLVAELPLPWSLASAETFARGAVAILAALGCTHLSFGSESGELEGLEKLAECLVDPLTIDMVKARLTAEPNLSFASARQLVLEERLGEVARLIETPNNILAVEYLKAIRELNAEMKPLTVRRTGSGHDEVGDGAVRSASELRQMLCRGADISAYVPERAVEVFRREMEQGRMAADRRTMEIALLSRLRMLDEKTFAELPDGGDGVGRRLCKAAKEEPTLERVLEAAKTKRIALSRLRRMCMAAVLGLDKTMAAGQPPYIRVLAANEKGRAYLRKIDSKTTIPVVTKPAEVKHIGAEAAHMFAVGASAHDLYTLQFVSNDDRRGGSDWRTGPEIV